MKLDLTYIFQGLRITIFQLANESAPGYWDLSLPTAKTSALSEKRTKCVKLVLKDLGRRIIGIIIGNIKSPGHMNALLGQNKYCTKIEFFQVTSENISFMATFL